MRVVSRGKIRVDARRAVEKLREHLLLDLHDYGREVVRAAVAGGARVVDLSHDADDLWLSWDVAAMPTASLPTLLDHVLTEASSTEGRVLRLLALGVNAALGLSPAFVDVYVRDLGGELACVRWTPALLTGKGEPAIRQTTSDLPPGATRVHVRRPFGWQVLRRTALGGTLPELSSLAAATADLPITLTLNGQRWKQRRPSVLLRVPLHVGLEVTRAELQVLAGPGGRIDLCEQGVRLVSHRLELASFGLDGNRWRPFRMRILIDAPALPTNASRSAIRDDSDLFARVAEQTDHAIARAVAALRVRTVSEDTPDLTRADRAIGDLPIDDVEVASGPQAVDEALAVLLEMAAQAERRKAALGDAVRELLALPVLANACGEPKSFAELEKVATHRYTGAEPLESALSPWLGGVVWLRGRAVDRVFANRGLPEATDVVDRAREALLHRQRFFAHAEGHVEVPPRTDQLLRQRFAVSRGHRRGLSGEVALRVPPSPTTPSTVRVFHVGREIATRQIARSVVPLCLDIAITWDAQIRVRFDFEDVEDDVVLTTAIWHATTVAVDVAAEISERATGLEALDDDERSRLYAVLRAAIGCALGAGPALGLDHHLRGHVPRGLAEAPIWPTTSGRWMSLEELRVDLDRRGAVMVAAPKVRGRAPDGRPVVAVDPSEETWLAAALGHAPLVAYDGVLTAPREPRRALHQALRRELELQQIEATASMAFEREGARGVAVVARASRLAELHGGRFLSAAPRMSAFGEAILVVDDDAIVPSARWNGILSRGDAWSPDDVDRELASRLVSAVGAAATRVDSVLELPDGDDMLVRCYLIATAARIRDGSRVGDAALLDRIQDLPLVRALDETGREVRISLARLDAIHPGPGPIPTLEAAPGFETLDWWPLMVTDPHEGRTLAAYADRLTNGEPLLPEHADRARRAQRRREILSRAVVDPFQLGTLAPGDAITGRVEDGGDTVLAALPPGLAEPPHAIADVAYRGHPIGRFTLEGAPPLVARVSLADEACFDALTSLSGSGLRRAKILLLAAARALAQALATRDRPVGDPRHAALLLFLVRQPDVAKVRHLVTHTTHFAQAQGGAASLSRMCKGRTILYATQRFVPWTRGSRVELDDPVLHLTDHHDGARVRQLVEALGFALRDATAAMAKLQARRGGGAAESPLRLEGSPAHPALRRGLRELGAGTLKGEIELALDGTSRITVVDLEGTPRETIVELPCAVRAVVCTGTLPSKRSDELMRIQLRRALRKLVSLAASHLDALPPAARVAHRAVLIDKLEHGSELSAADREARVFEDIRRRHHGLATLCSPLLGTTRPPPFPASEERVVLRWSERERDVLGRTLAVEDVSDAIAAALEADRRRAAARLPAIVAQDVATVAKTRITEAALEGEVALLAPSATEHRGIAVLHAGRPLCWLHDGPGWPLLATLDTLAAPNARFDGLAEAADAEALVQRARAVAADLTAARFAAPGYAIASRAVDTTGAEVLMVGRLWLAPSLEDAGPISVHTAAGTVAVRPSRALGAPHFDPTIPIEGELLLASTNGEARRLLDDVALALFGAMVAELDHPRYAWQSALLSTPGHAQLTAPTADGGHVDVQQILHELHTRGAVWTSDRRGAVYGDLPQSPAFVLLAEPGSALLDVLHLRDRGGLVRELGRPVGKRSPVPPTQGDDPRAMAGAPIAADGDEPGTSRTGSAQRDATHDVEVVDGWLEGLLVRLHALFREPPPSPPGGRGLRDALLAALRGIGLQGEPVVDVVFSRRGRPLRYDRDRRCIVLHRSHEAVVALAPDDTPSSAAIEALAVAAVSEINRADRAVTAAEERRVILAALRDARAEDGP